MNIIILLIYVFCALSLYIIPDVSIANTPEKVLIVVNINSEISKAIGKYYQKKRNIPEKNICYIRCPEKETISRLTYESKIMIPIARYIQENNLTTKVSYIVTTKGVPLRIKGTKGLYGNRASVDSELTLLQYNMPVDEYGYCQYYDIAGIIPNPYYNIDKQFKGDKHFNSKIYGIYLVTRLTGYTFDDVRHLIDRGCCKVSGVKKGVFILDATTKRSIGNIWIRRAWYRLQKREFKVRYDATKKYLRYQKNVIGYCGWGSNDRSARHKRFLHNQWLPGAIGITFVSSSGRTFKEPPKTWKPGTHRNLLTYYAGTPQSLSGDLIREGITGIDAYVYEPYLEGCTQPHILFMAYVTGYNLAESYYMAIPYLSWQNVVIGDPLCKPFGDNSKNR